ncbi:hypothetical protein KM043_004453 [Ampulex compressa]|nr:hypothetical protein KM043_004453 [Ampulex compressa]
MGEPKPASSPQPNGGVKQKPTSLNLAPGPGFYRNVNGRLNDRHLQHVTAVAGGGRAARAGKSASPGPPVNNLEPGAPGAVQLPALPAVSSLSALPPAWALSAELENLLEPPPPPAPAASSSPRSGGELQHDELRSSPINQLPSRSPSHNGHGFPLYTPPAPIPASGASKVRSTPNGLPQPAAPRRPHSIAAPPYHAPGVHLGQQPGRASIPAAGAPQAGPWPPNGPPPPSTTAACVPSLVQRRAHSVAGTPVSVSPGVNGLEQEPRTCPPPAGTLVPATRSAVPPQSLWNGQPLPRRPHSIASTPVTAAPPPPTSAACLPSRPAGEPLQWGASGMVLHQPVPRRPYAATLPHPQPPTPTSQGPALSILANPGGSNTWTAGAGLRQRPHSIASTPQGPASPSDSGYRSLPSAASDYQILKSPSRSQAKQQCQSATRRLSLPSAQTLLRATAPRPSPTFHGLPFRPFTCGVSPNGNPIFLGCTHLHTGGSSRASTPATSPATPLTTSQAIQQLLAQPRNGFKIVDDKVSLFIEILDTQERFAKHQRTCGVPHYGHGFRALLARRLQAPRADLNRALEGAREQQEEKEAAKNRSERNRGSK